MKGCLRALFQISTIMGMLFLFCGMSQAGTIRPVLDDTYNLSRESDSRVGSLPGNRSIKAIEVAPSSITIPPTSVDTSKLAAAVFSNGNNGGMGSVGSKFPEVKVMEGCVAGGPNCEGAGNNGMGQGQSDIFNPTLNGSIPDNSIKIEPSALKYQTGRGSFELTSNRCAPVPEPASGSLALMGLALMGAGFGLRRRVGRK